MALIDDAIEFLDLQDWLEQYVETQPGGGSELRICCPKCHEDDFKCYVNTDLKCWICYKCDWGRGLGDAAYLMSEASGMSISEVRKDLLHIVVPAPTGDLTAALTNIFDPQDLTNEEPSEIEAVELPGFVSWEGVSSKRVKDYGIRRGLDDSDFQRYQLRAAGKLRSYPGPWLVFPIIYQGVPVGWQGRAIVPNPEPKFVSSDHIDRWLWPVNDPVPSSVVLVEGVLDVAGLSRLGVPALCTFGKSISDSQISLLRTLGVGDLIIGWDADAYKEIQRAVNRLCDFSIRVADFSFEGGKRDAGDVLTSVEVGEWVRKVLTDAMPIGSSEYFQWRLGK